jgi:glutathione S-transferase
MPSSRPTPNLTLYTSQTPNGIKISITLAELGLPYKAHKIDMSTNEQKSPWFTAINPNGRIPALTDTHTDGNDIHIFESGSIMQYLVETYDTEYKISYPRGSREAIEMTVRCLNVPLHAIGMRTDFDRTGSSSKTQA